MVDWFQGRNFMVKENGGEKLPGSRAREQLQREVSTQCTARPHLLSHQVLLEVCSNNTLGRSESSS